MVNRSVGPEGGLYGVSGRVVRAGTEPECLLCTIKMSSFDDPTEVLPRTRIQCFSNSSV